MKSGVLKSSLALAAFFSLGMFAFAQHGRAGMGGGPGMSGMGGPPIGAGPGMGAAMGPGMGAGMGAGNYGRASNAGNPGMGRSSADMSHMGSQSPSSVLSNQHLNTALTNALGKSGVTIPGGNLQSACQGFKNLGGCVAALHISKNLGLNFDQLRGMMTGPHAESLGKAIQGLGGPNVTTKKEVKKAVKQANKQSEQDLHAAAKTSINS